MSDPYAGRTRVLSDDQRADIQRWIRDAAGLLGLMDWRVHVSPLEAVDGAIASSHLRDEASVSWIAVSSQFLEADTEERTTTLIHELLHCHFQPITRLAEKLHERELGARTEAVIDTAVSMAEERTIDRLAGGLARILPPFRFSDPGASDLTAGASNVGPCQMAPPNAIYPLCRHPECMAIRGGA